MAQLLSTVIRKRIWGLSKEKKSLKLLAQRKAVRQKHSLVVSDTRQVILPACRTWGVLQLAPTIPWSTRNKTDFCVTGVNFSSFFLSWNKQSFWLPPQISPAHNFFLWACKPWTHFPLVSLQSHKRQGYHKADAVARSKREWPGLRRRVNITQQLCIGFVQWWFHFHSIS